VPKKKEDLAHKLDVTASLTKLKKVPVGGASEKKIEGSGEKKIQPGKEKHLGPFCETTKGNEGGLTGGTALTPQTQKCRDGKVVERSTWKHHGGWEH